MNVFRDGVLEMAQHLMLKEEEKNCSCSKPHVVIEGLQTKRAPLIISKTED